MQQQQEEVSPGEIAAMADQGRRAVVLPTNRIVFATRRGAWPSPADTGPNSVLPMAPIGDPKHDADWNTIFHRPAPVVTPTPVVSPVPVVRPTPPAGANDTAMPRGPDFNNEDWQPTPTAEDHIAAAVKNNTGWLARQGIAVPPPPSALSTAMDRPTRLLITPDMNQDPALQKSKFVTAGGVDPDYASRVQQFNTNLYKPLDTQQPAAPVSRPVWNRTGWNQQPSTVAPGSYQTPYGPIWSGRLQTDNYSTGDRNV